MVISLIYSSTGTACVFNGLMWLLRIFASLYGIYMGSPFSYFIFSRFGQLLLLGSASPARVSFSHSLPSPALSGFSLLHHLCSLTPLSHPTPLLSLSNPSTVSWTPSQPLLAFYILPCSQKYKRKPTLKVIGSSSSNQ